MTASAHATGLFASVVLPAYGWRGLCFIGGSAYLVMLGSAMTLVLVALAIVRRHIPPMAVRRS